jgi:hypothetical protein
MTQRDIDRAVARATGETVGRVHQIDFTLVVIPPYPLPRRHLNSSLRDSERGVVSTRREARSDHRF